MTVGQSSDCPYGQADCPGGGACVCGLPKPDEAPVSKSEPRRWTLENRWCECCGWQTVVIDGPDLEDEFDGLQVVEATLRGQRDA